MSGKRRGFWVTLRQEDLDALQLRAARQFRTFAEEAALLMAWAVRNCPEPEPLVRDGFVQSVTKGNLAAPVGGDG